MVESSAIVTLLALPTLQHPAPLFSIYASDFLLEMDNQKQLINKHMSVLKQLNSNSDIASSHQLISG